MVSWIRTRLLRMLGRTVAIKRTLSDANAHFLSFEARERTVCLFSDIIVTMVLLRKLRKLFRRDSTPHRGKGDELITYQRMEKILRETHVTSRPFDVKVN